MSETKFGWSIFQIKFDDGKENVISVPLKPEVKRNWTQPPALRIVEPIGGPGTSAPKTSSLRLRVVK